MTRSSGKSPCLFAVQAGALGNQLFALATLQDFVQDGRLYLLGYQQLSRFLELDSFAKLHSERWAFAAARYGVRVLDRLNFLKPLVGEVGESTDGRAISPKDTKKILLAHDVYFQRWPGTGACEEIRSRIRQEHIDCARQTLTRVINPGETAVFLHLRRGDYLTWPDPDSPAVLPEEWTLGALRRMREYVSRPRILVLSDDPTYARTFAGLFPDTTHVSGSVFHDLALMGECQAGITSASSLSWWGSTFAALNHVDGPFLAPSFWIGHQRNMWYPEGISAPHLTFV